LVDLNDRLVNVKTNHSNHSGQSSNGHVGDYFCQSAALCTRTDHHFDYSDTGHDIDHLRIDSHAQLISTDCGRFAGYRHLAAVTSKLGSMAQ
jgi:hypothetical protein